MTFDEKRKFTRHDYIAEVKYRSNCPPEEMSKKRCQALNHESSIDSIICSSP